MQLPPVGEEGMAPSLLYMPFTLYFPSRISALMVARESISYVCRAWF